MLRERDVLTLALLVPYCEAEALLHIGLPADRVREEHRHERPHELRDQRLDQTGQAADGAWRLGATLAIVNREPTPLDDVADVVVHEQIGPTMAMVAGLN